MHVCSTEEGMMAKLNVTNDHSSPSASHFVSRAGWRRRRGSWMKSLMTAEKQQQKEKYKQTKKQERLSCVDTTVSLCDRLYKEKLMNLTAGTWDKAALITAFLCKPQWNCHGLYGYRAITYRTAGALSLDLLALPCHQRHEAQQSFSWNPNLEDFMWSGDTIRETTSRSLYPAPSSSYTRLPAWLYWKGGAH